MCSSDLYVSTDGSIVVRKSDDYIPSMIEIALTELKMKEMQLINWFGCPNLIYTRERIHLVAMLTTDEEMKKNLYRVCRFLAREEIAYRYPIMYEMIRKIFSPDDTNPPEACAMFMPDDETDDEEYAMAA